MGDLERDTAVEAVDAQGRFRARLSKEWEIWGPMGGYVASIALRAAGAVSPFDRPASFFCHYLAVASFDEIDLEVTTLRQARTAASHRVVITQGERTILEATVWSTGDVEGLEHSEANAPDVPRPEELPTIEDLLTDEEKEARPPFPFWLNFDSKPLAFRRDWPPSGPLAPQWRQWSRFRPTATFADPWVDACRSLVLIDVQSWPSASNRHAWSQPPFIAPSLDLYVAFHEPAPGEEWLLTDGYSPVGAEGLLAWNGRLWSQSGRLVATGAGQMLCRRVGTS